VTQDTPKPPALREHLAEIVTGAIRGGGMDVVNAILAQPNAAELVAALHPEELHRLVHELGKQDSVDILRCASVEQVQGMLDLDDWVAGSFSPDRLQEMLGIAAAAGDDVVERLFEAMDDETIGLFLLKRCKVLQRTFEPEQEEQLQEQGEYFLTPDGAFFVLLPFKDRNYAAVRFFVEHLYGYDKEEAISLLKTLVYEEADVLEEEALRFRNARVGTMGFPSGDEVQRIFKYLNPVKAREKVRSTIGRFRKYPAQERSLLPALVGLEHQEAPFLQKALGRLSDDADRATFAEALVTLSNAVYAHATSGDLAAMARYPDALRRSLSLFNLGLEYITDGNAETAGALLTRIWPKTLFRIGHSATVLLREHARKLMGVSGAEHGFFLFDPPLDEVIRGAVREVPQYFEGIADESKTTWRDFRSLSEFTRTKAVLKQAEEVAKFCLAVLRADPAKLAETVPEPLRPAVTHTTLMATALLNGLLGREDLLAPIPVKEVASVSQVVLVAGAGGTRQVNPRLVEAMNRFNSTAENQFAAALIELSLKKLQDAFERLPSGADPDPRFLAGAVLVKP